jgi:ABC-type molybdate transport system permease subunit
MSTYNSYQKYDGASGTYQEVGSNIADDSRRVLVPKYAKGLLAAVLVTVAGALYGATGQFRGDSAQETVEKALNEHSAAEVLENGQLKLFDEYSKYHNNVYNNYYYYYYYCCCC